MPFGEDLDILIGERIAQAKANGTQDHGTRRIGRTDSLRTVVVEGSIEPLGPLG